MTWQRNRERSNMGTSAPALDLGGGGKREDRGPPQTKPDWYRAWTITFGALEGMIILAIIGWTLWIIEVAR